MYDGCWVSALYNGSDALLGKGHVHITARIVACYWAIQRSKVGNIACVWTYM